PATSSASSPRASATCWATSGKSTASSSPARGCEPSSLRAGAGGGEHLGELGLFGEAEAPRDLHAPAIEHDEGRHALDLAEHARALRHRLLRIVGDGEGRRERDL